MPDNNNSKVALRKINGELIQAIHQAQEAARPPRTQFAPDEYAAKISSALLKLKEVSKLVFEHGHMRGLAQIGNIASQLEETGGERRFQAADEIFWDLVSQNFPVTSNCEVKLSWLSTPLQLRIFEQMVLQDQNPYPGMTKQIQRVSKDAFMGAMQIAIELTHPREVEGRPEFYEPLLQLKARVHEPEFMLKAVEHIAAHRDLFLDYFNRITRVCALQEAMKPIGGYEDPEKLVPRRRRLIMGAMGYDEQGMQEMMDSQADQNVVPDTATFIRMKNALALPPQMLLMLHQETGADVILEMAQYAVDYPSGLNPYGHLERMGVVRPPEWHRDAQERTNLDEALHLFEYAIHTPGVEIHPFKLINPGFVYKNVEKNSSVISRAVGILAGTPIKDPECLRKGQAMFDAMVQNMESGAGVGKLREALESGDIPSIFYRKYPKLKVARLENDMGM